MALLPPFSERSVEEWISSYVGAFGALTFGDDAGMDITRTLGLGTRPAQAGEVLGLGVGGAFTPMEQAYLAGKLAGEVGTNPVRRMSERELREAVARTGTTLDDADRALIEANLEQGRRSLRNRARKAQQNVGQAVAQANRDWQGDLRSGAAGRTTAARRTARQARLRLLESQIQREVAKFTSQNATFVRTQAAQFFQDAQVAKAPPEEIVYKIPRTNAEFHCMRLHLNPDGTPIRYRLADVEGNSNIGVPPPAWTFTIGPVHPNCLLPGTRVDARDVLAVSERRYEGEVVVFSTACGEELSVTPNHPVLTDAGWVPAAFLHEGSRVVRDLRRQWEPRQGHQDEENVPARVEDVAEALRLSPTSMSHHVPGTAKQFHGDGIEGEIGVVRSDRPLRNTYKPTLREHVGEGFLVLAVEAAARLAVLRSTQECFRRVGLAAPSSMGGFGEGATPFRAGLFHAQGACSGPPSPWDSLLVQPALHDVGGHSEGVRYSLGGLSLDVARGDGLLVEVEPSLANAAGSEEPMESGPSDTDAARNFARRFAGQVALDEVVHIERRQFSGHVYNLQTREGWYWAESIATKNCYCILHRESVEPAPPPNRALANARAQELDRARAGGPGGDIIPSDVPGLRSSQAARARRLRTDRSGGQGAARVVGDRVTPATQRELDAARRIEERLSRVRNRGSVAAELGNMELHAEASLALLDAPCCAGDKPIPEDQERVLAAVRAVYGDDSPLR